MFGLFSRGPGKNTKKALEEISRILHEAGWDRPEGEETDEELIAKLQCLAEKANRTGRLRVTLEIERVGAEA